jgi:hypothetical protein
VFIHSLSAAGIETPAQLAKMLRIVLDDLLDSRLASFDIEPLDGYRAIEDDHEGFTLALNGGCTQLEVRVRDLANVPEPETTGGGFVDGLSPD